MIEFHRPENDSFSDQIEETFEELVLAYKTRHYNGNEDSMKDRDIPRIEDGDGVYRGEKEIREYIHQLRLDLKSMRAFTGDACYVDPESGEVC